MRERAEAPPNKEMERTSRGGFIPLRLALHLGGVAAGRSFLSRSADKRMVGATKVI